MMANVMPPTPTEVAKSLIARDHRATGPPGGSVVVAEYVAYWEALLDYVDEQIEREAFIALPVEAYASQGRLS